MSPDTYWLVIVPLIAFLIWAIHEYVTRERPEPRPGYLPITLYGPVERGPVRAVPPKVKALQDMGLEADQLWKD